MPEQFIEVWRKGNDARIYAVERLNAATPGIIYEFNLKNAPDWVLEEPPGSWLQQRVNASWYRETENASRETQHAALEAYRQRARKAGFARIISEKRGNPTTDQHGNIVDLSTLTP